jgi:hypothetical protein
MCAGFSECQVPNPTMKLTGAARMVSPMDLSLSAAAAVVVRPLHSRARNHRRDGRRCVPLQPVIPEDIGPLAELRGGSSLRGFLTNHRRV